MIAAPSTLSTRVLEAETSTDLEKSPPRTIELPQACSISRSSMMAPLYSTVQVALRGRDGKHSPHECRRIPCARPSRAKGPQHTSTSSTFYNTLKSGCTLVPAKTQLSHSSGSGVFVYGGDRLGVVVAASGAVDVPP